MNLLNRKRGGLPGGEIHLNRLGSRGGGIGQGGGQSFHAHAPPVGLPGQQDLVVPDLIASVQGLQGQFLRQAGHALLKNLLIPVLSR